MNIETGKETGIVYSQLKLHAYIYMHGKKISSFLAFNWTEHMNITVYNQTSSK